MQSTPHGPRLVGAIVCLGLAAGLAVVSTLFVVQAVGEYGRSGARAPLPGRAFPFAIVGLWSLRCSLDCDPSSQEEPVGAIFAAVGADLSGNLKC